MSFMNTYLINIDFYVKQIKETRYGSFELIKYDDPKEGMKGGVWYRSSASIMFIGCILCSCGVKILKEVCKECRKQFNRVSNHSWSSNRNSDRADRAPSRSRRESQRSPRRIEVSSNVLEISQMPVKTEAQILSSFEKFTYDSQTIEENKFKLTECCICLEEFTLGVGVVRVPTCKHYFHPQCIKEWISKKTQCPLCNAKLN